MGYLIELTTAGTEAFCIILVLHAFFEYRHQKGAFLFSAVVALGLYLWLPLHTPLADSFVAKLMISAFIWLVYTQMSYTGTPLFHLFVLCAFFVVLSAVDYITIFAVSRSFSVSLSQALSNGALYLFGAFCARMLLLLVSIAVYRVAKAKPWQGVTAGTWLCLLVFPAFSVVLFGLLIQSAMKKNEADQNLLFVGIGLLLFHMVLFVLLAKLEHAAEFRQKNILLQQEMERNLKFTNALQAVYEQQRAQVHDFNNHITTLYQLLKEGHYKKAMQYSEKLSSNPIEGGGVISTNHPVIDAILNQKYTQARLQKTSMRFSVNDLSNFPMKDEDTVVLLGNLLDNALEACRKISCDSYITVKLLEKHGVFLLSIENSSQPVKISENYRVKTDKAAPYLHGFGLENIARIMKKYAYEYTLFYADGCFHFAALLS